MDNLDLWLRHSESDPANLKKVEFGRKFISIDPQSQLMDATREWGPWGTGFGIKDLAYDFVREESGRIISVFAAATFWYKDESGVHECKTASDITPFYAKSGKPEEDWAKKLMTSMVSKELSRLGFNADVFMGKWDGCPYIGKGPDDRGAPEKAEKWADQKNGSGASGKAKADPPRQAEPSQAPAPGNGITPDDVQRVLDGGPAVEPDLSPEDLMAKVRACDNVKHLGNIFRRYKKTADNCGFLPEFTAACGERKAEILGNPPMSAEVA